MVGATTPSRTSLRNGGRRERHHRTRASVGGIFYGRRNSDGCIFRVFASHFYVFGEWVCREKKKPGPGWVAAVRARRQRFRCLRREMLVLALSLRLRRCVFAWDGGRGDVRSTTGSHRCVFLLFLPSTHDSAAAGCGGLWLANPQSQLAAHHTLLSLPPSHAPTPNIQPSGEPHEGNPHSQAGAQHLRW